MRTVAVVVLLLALLSLGLGGCTSGTSGTDSGNSVAPAITTQPTSQTVTAGQTATFTVVATGTAPLSYQWQKGTTNISGATSSSYTTPPTVLADSGSTYRVIVTNSVGNATSNSATLTVNSAPPPSTVSVLTYHNDNARTGLNANETILTTSNVRSATFGKVGTISVDGLVDAEPLYVGSLNIGGTVRNVLFVATEHDSVYAFDADTFIQLWKQSVLGSGETTVAASDVGGCKQVNPEIGITSTPVIDHNQGPHGSIFVVAMSKNGSSYFHRLHALDVTTGAEIGTPTTINATFQRPGQPAGQVVTFVPKLYKERAALLLLNSVIYTSWASHCDSGSYTGWVMGFSESTLQATSVLNITPNGSKGAIWMSGGGPAADSSGNMYLLDGNGTFDTPDASGLPPNGDYGNAFLKLSTGGNSLSVADYFNMHDTASESNNDFDLGSGGAIVLLDVKDNGGTTWHLAVGAGKDSRIYVVNRDNMGKFNATTDNVYQEITGAFNCNPGIFECVFSTPAYFNKTIYYAAVGDTLKAFPFVNAKLVSPASSLSPTAFGYPGTTPSISANGTTNAIIWAIEGCSSSTSCTGALHAYDATNLANELYNSNQASGGRDHFSTNADCKFVTPMIANGKVYVGTGTNSGSASGAVVVYGLLP